MKRFGLVLLTLLASSAQGRSLQDLHFGEALYYANQGNYFQALERMDAELLQHYRLDQPDKDSLQAHIGEAEFSIGDFELSYRMHHRAGRAIQAVLEADVAEPVRNKAAYRLARIHFQKGQMQAALHALDRIQGDLDREIQAQVMFLRANVYLAQGRPDEAATLLRDLPSNAALRGFSDYNLGVALWRSGDSEKAYRALHRAGTLQVTDAAQRAIRDKANLVLGTLLSEAGVADEAVPAFQRIHLRSPFSNQALLSSGLADARNGRYDRAVVSWNELAERDPTQASVQEARLALPYAYVQLGVHGRAAVLYSNALSSFGDELGKLESSINSIRSGQFLKMLVRGEIRHDRDWVVRLRTLPDAPETHYLTELMASHEFQTTLSNYLDLQELKDRLQTWQKSFLAFDDLLESRLAHYEPILPDIDNRFRALDSRMRLRRQQQRIIERRMHELLTAPRPEVLATTEEAETHAALNRMHSALQDQPEEATADLVARINRLRGVLLWGLRVNYHERLTQLHLHLKELNLTLADLDSQYDHYVRVRQSASHSYQGYDQPFSRLENLVTRKLTTIDTLMKKQSIALEQVAIATLEQRQERLRSYQNTARFAMADSYDRATKVLQAGGQ